MRTWDCQLKIQPKYVTTEICNKCCFSSETTQYSPSLQTNTFPNQLLFVLRKQRLSLNPVLLQWPFGFAGPVQDQTQGISSFYAKEHHDSLGCEWSSRPLCTHCQGWVHPIHGAWSQEVPECSTMACLPSCLMEHVIQVKLLCNLFPPK